MLIKIRYLYSFIEMLHGALCLPAGRGFIRNDRVLLLTEAALGIAAASPARAGIQRKARPPLPSGGCFVAPVFLKGRICVPTGTPLEGGNAQISKGTGSKRTGLLRIGTEYQKNVFISGI